MITAVSTGLVQACVDQPLTVVETPRVTGGTASVVAEIGGAHGHEGGSDERTVGSKGSNVATGGRTTTNTKEWATGGNTAPLSCPGHVGDACDSARGGCCWGLVCDAGMCRKENGSPCDSEDDCRASSSCKGGICTSDDYFTCLRIGKRCTNSGQCCSGKCDQAQNDSEKRCQEIEGCKPVMEYSQSAWACCSSELVTPLSSGAYCFYHREAGVETCKLSGETCGDVAWDDKKQCCDGLACLVGPESVPRCTAKPSQSGKCNTSRDCAKIGPAEAPSEPRCIRHSDPEEAAGESPGATYGTCEVCVEEGGTCQVDYDCCEGQGLECNSDVCTKAAF